MSATHEHTHTTESAAHDARRRLINRGARTSLVAFDPSRNVYAFDEILDCCDGTGWTGNPHERCTEHYEPLDAIWFS